MQDRYVGDVGDFGKYGLLRSLTASGSLSLSVVWYLFPNEDHNSDGRHVGYLDKPEFDELDPQLHNELRTIIELGVRSISQIEKGPIFPTGTRFFSEPVPEARRGHDIAGARELWLERAIEESSGADLVFVDPDNGLETKSVPIKSKKSGKYVFWHELKRFWSKGHSLVVYHHLNRTAPVAVQTERLRQRFDSEFPNAELIQPLLFRRGSCRHFWIVGQSDHSPFLVNSIDQLFSSNWSAHFSRA